MALILQIILYHYNTTTQHFENKPQQFKPSILQGIISRGRHPAYISPHGETLKKNFLKKTFH